MLAIRLVLLALQYGLFALASRTGYLKQLYLDYPDDADHPRFDHWLEYANEYEANVRHLQHKNNLKILEIGVQNGGSIHIWDSYFASNNLTYVGVDIEPKCKRLEQKQHKSSSVTIEIGSQSDREFMTALCKKHGPFDIIVDDGGHMTNLIMASFEVLWPHCMIDNGVYVMEDLHAMTIFGNQQYQGKDIFGHMGDLMRKRSAYLKFNQRTFQFEVAEPDPVAKHIARMIMSDSLIVLHFRMNWQPLTHIVRGKQEIIKMG